MLSGATTQVSPPPVTTLAFAQKLSVFGEEICTDTAIQSFSRQERWAKLKQHVFCTFELSRAPPRTKARSPSPIFPPFFKKATPTVAVSDAPGAGAVTLGKVRNSNNEKGNKERKAEGTGGTVGWRWWLWPQLLSQPVEVCRTSPLPKAGCRCWTQSLVPARRGFPTSHPLFTVPHQTRVWHSARHLARPSSPACQHICCHSWKPWLHPAGKAVQPLMV